MHKRKDGTYQCPACKETTRNKTMGMCHRCYREYRDMVAILEEPNWSVPRALQFLGQGTQRRTQRQLATIGDQELWT